MDEIIREFLVESQENLNKLDTDLVTLEQNPQAQEILSRIFRIVHSIKGSVGFLGFQKLGAVAHAGENLLSRLRDGSLRLNPPIASGLLAMSDAMRQMLNAIETSGSDGADDFAGLIEQLHQLQEDSASAEAPAPAPPPSAPATAGATTSWTSPVAPESTPNLGDTITLEPPGSSPPSPPPTAPIPVETLSTIPRAGVPPYPPHQQASPTPSVLMPPSPAVTEMATRSEPPEPSRKSTPPALADTTIRVDVALLDRLMNLVGELVLARNQILQHTADREDATLQATSQRLNLITTELQEGMVKTRMQPIGSLWSKLPRVVRDLAVECGKRVRVEMEGESTELDRTVIEAIKDPITHVVRNAVDHGIEPPERRVILGKPMEGLLVLKAFHEGGQVNIEISDDGAGIDPERIKQKAIERGLISPDQAARLSERELIHLVFLPGFSTAEQLTLLSGRGVGMDVVKTGIEKIGGTVDLHSKPGEGTLIRIKIPLTLAIINALLVSCDGERYAIPQVHLTELIRIDAGLHRHGIEWFHDAPVYRYRDKLLPLVRLREVLSPRSGADAVVQPEEAVNILVLQADEQRFGLVVERINDAQEIVVRPLASQLKGIACFAGATILGDGRIALILDVLGLARQAGVVASSRAKAAVESESEHARADAPELRTSMLLVEGTDSRRLAIPIERVERLEMLEAPAVEDSGGRPVVQYRGEILPLVDIAALLSGDEARALGMQITAGLETLPVVVCAEADRSVGLVCKRILDIIEEPVKVKGSASRPGVVATVVVQGHVTEVIDVDIIVRAGAPTIATPSGGAWE